MTATPSPVAPFLTRADLDAGPGGPRRWVWDGYLGPGLLTLFSSRWKSGKTTLLGLLLARMAEGGTLAGAAVGKGTALVVSEEPRDVWRERCDRLGIGGHVRWRLRPFCGPPTPGEYAGLVKDLEAAPDDLLVIDPLAMVLPAHAENQASAVLAALAPLQALADRGRAVAVLHHPRKGTAREFNHRGSGALTGAADVLMELTPPHPAGTADRRRWLRAVSRVGEPTARLMELSADGREYAVLAEPPPTDSFEAGWAVLRAVLEDAEMRLSRHGVMKQWPRDFDAPHPSTLRRWLEQALAEGRVNRTGTGRRASPFLYALPGKRFDPLRRNFEITPHEEFLRGLYGNAPAGGVLDEKRMK